MTVYGYARVSTEGQDHASQVAALEAAGCGRIVAEKITGVPALQDARWCV